jgi:hypothetical protein
LLACSGVPSLVTIRSGTRRSTSIALGEHVWVDNRDQRFSAGLQVLVHGLEQALGLTPPNPD